MKYAVLFALLAGPALAHEGAHTHPHGVDAWVIAASLLTLALAGFITGRVLSRSARK